MFQKMLALCMMVVLLATTVPAMAEEDAHKAFAVQYVTDLMGGEKNAELYDMFTDKVKAQFPKEAFEAIWPQLTVLNGSFEGFGSFVFQQAQGYDVYVLRLNFVKKDLLLQLTMDAEGKMAGLNFGEAPKEEKAPKSNLPEGIVEEEVTIGQGTWALPGTLTLPKEGSNFPAVLLVHGSGPNDRNETVGGTNLFKDLAWALAQKGIAVLRYDKRTFAHGDLFTQEAIATLTVKEEVVDDALLAGQLLANDSRINSKKIFLAGHSEGAMLGSRIVSQSGGIFAGMALISGSPLPLTDIILTQNEDAMAKLTEDQRAASKPMLDAELEKLDALDAMTPEEAQKVTVFGFGGWYLKEMRQYDSAELVLALKLPTLIMQGGKDFQVSVANGLDAWKNAVGETEFVTYKLYPELNHAMMRYTGDPALQYTVQEYNTPATADADAVSDLIGWILSH